MASGKTLQSTIEISGVLSPSLQAAINSAVDRLAEMAEETLDSADAASRLVAEMSEQENILKTLKKAYAGYALEGEESSDAAQELAKRIEDVSEELSQNKQRLDAAERAADSFGKELDQAEESAESASDGFTVMKGVLANLVSKGIEVAAEGVRNLYSAYQEFDDGADTIIAKTGATGAAAESLQKVYENVSQTVPASFSDIGTAVGEINTRFGVTDDTLEDLSVKFLKFAELNGTDVNGAVDSVQKALEAFGLDADDAGGVLDTLNKVGQDTGITMDTLSTSLLENASFFSQMGLDIHQAAGFLGDIEKSGVTTQVAMTALSKASQIAAKEGKPLTATLEETSDRMANAKTDAEGLQVAYEVFGKKAGAKIYEACKNGSLSFDELSKAMQNNSGSIEETYEATQDGMDKIKLAIQGAKAKVGDAVATFFDEHKDTIVKLIERAGDAVDWLVDKLPYLGIALGAISAVIVAMKWGSIVGQIQKVGGAFAGLFSKIGAIPAPVLIVIGVIAALAAAFAYLWKTNEEFRNSVSAIWGELQGSFSQLGGTISSTISQLAPIFSQLASTVLSAIAQIAEVLIPVILQIIQAILPILIDLINQLLPVFMQIIQAILPILVDLINQLMPVVIQIIQAVLPILVDLLNMLLPVVMQIIQAILPILIDLINQLMPVVLQIIQAVLPILVDLINQLLPVVMQIIQAVLPILVDLINQLLPVVMQIIQAILPVLVDLINMLLPIIMQLINATMPIIQAILPVVIQLIQFLLPIIEKVISVISVVASVITSVLSKAIQFVMPIIQGLTNGFRSVINFISNVFQGKWSSIWQSIVDKFGSIFGTIIGIAKAPINGVIGIINKAINAMNKISYTVPDWVPGIGGETFGFNIPTIPQLATGGFTEGVSIAGEAGMEAVISFDPAYHDRNVGIWQEAGKLLGVLEQPKQDGRLTAAAGKLLTLDDFSLGSLAGNTSVVYYYDFSGFTWSPQIQNNGSNDEDSFMAKLKAHEAEFFDWLEEFVKMREEALYA